MSGIVPTIGPGHEISFSIGPQPVVVMKNGEVLADTERPLFLHETGCPDRLYVPREDLVARVDDSDRHTHCPFKGEASYYNVAGHENIAWYYPEPIEGMERIKGRVAFYNDRVEIWERVTPA
jgi:uncharacterized protein (DUF427 family)